MTKTETATLTATQSFAPYDTAAFKANLRKLDTKINGLDNLVHELLVTAIYHAQEHENYDFIGRVLTSVRKAKTIRNEAVKGWCQKHCNVKVDDGGTEIRTSKDKRSEVVPDWKAAYANPFWDDSQFSEPKAFGLAEAIKSYYAVVTKIKRAVEGKAKNMEVSEEEKGKLLMFADLVSTNGMAIEKAIADLNPDATDEDEVTETVEVSETVAENVEVKKAS